jgi:hypothetical protein
VGTLPESNQTHNDAALRQLVACNSGSPASIPGLYHKGFVVHTAALAHLQFCRISLVCGTPLRLCTYSSIAGTLIISVSDTVLKLYTHNFDVATNPNINLLYLTRLD